LRATPRHATLEPAGRPGGAYLLPKVRDALLREHRAFGIRVALATVRRNGWRRLDAMGIGDTSAIRLARLFETATGINDEEAFDPDRPSDSAIGVGSIRRDICNCLFEPT
jgi:hypothetical protein